MKRSTRKKIVIDDVAQVANVSTATVSRVINGYKGVSQTVIKRVNEAIDTLGYIVPSKTTGKKNSKKLIGIVVPNINNPYSSNLITEIQNTLYHLGYTVLIMDSNNKPDLSLSAVETLVDRGISGLIYMPVHTPFIEENRLSNLRIPMVCLGRKVPIKDICFVGPETFEASYNGANYLLSLGHKRILYVTGDRNSALNKSMDNEDSIRFSGFIKALKEKGVEFDEKHLISGDYNLVTTTKAVEQILVRENFSAIFTSGDVMAYGAYKAANKAGLSVPEDISILGFDDLPMSSVLDLSTVSHNTFGVGQNAGLLLHDLLEGKKIAPQEIILPTNLCIRSSCGISRN